MKKLLIVTLLSLLTLTGCNKQIVDLNYNFNYAIIQTANGVIEGKVTSWKDYEGDQIQVKIDGITYLVHSSNITLIHK